MHTDAMSHVVILDDSIFDNAAYVRGGPPVILMSRSKLPQGGRLRSWPLTAAWRNTCTANSIESHRTRATLSSAPAGITLLVTATFWARDGIAVPEFPGLPLYADDCGRVIDEIK
jgi:hypothetical protein